MRHGKWLALLVGTIGFQSFPSSASPAKVCSPNSSCFQGWIAAQDVGASGSFFESEGQRLLAENLKPSLIVRTNRPINVRNTPADWSESSIAFVLPRASAIELISIGSLEIPRFKTTQKWIFFRSSRIREKLKPPLSPGYPENAAAPKSERADSGSQGIWWEHPIAETTGGYNTTRRQTLIHSYNIAIRGPSSVEAAIQSVVEKCVTVAGGAAYTAFTSTPSPEPGVRIGAAWAAFKGSLYACFQGDAVAEAIKDQFEIVYPRRMRYEDGLVLRFAASNPQSEIYRKLHDAIGDRMPEPINKIAQFYIAATELPKIDIKLDPPALPGGYELEVPDPEEMQKMKDAYDKLAKAKGTEIIAVAKDEIIKAIKEGGPQQALKEGEKLQQVMVRASGEFAEQMKKEAPKIVESIVPTIEDGRLKWGPVVVDTPKINPKPDDPCTYMFCPHKPLKPFGVDTPFSIGASLQARLDSMIANKLSQASGMSSFACGGGGCAWKSSAH